MKSDHLHNAGFGIDFHLGNVAAAGEGEVLRIVERGFVQARLEFLDRIVMRDVSGQRDVSQRLRLVGPRDSELVIGELDVLDRGFHQMSGDLLALGDHFVHRLHHRGAANGQERLP